MRTLTVVAISIVLASLPSVDAARASPSPDEVRAAYVKNADASCFDGQSKQETNKSRPPEQLHALCGCFAEKMSYTQTIEQLVASAGKPFAPTADEEQLTKAVFANCWHVNVR